MFVTCVYPLMYENGCTFAMPFGRATRRRSRNHWLTFKGIAIVSCSTADEASKGDTTNYPHLPSYRHFSKLCLFVIDTPRVRSTSLVGVSEPFSTANTIRQKRSSVNRVSAKHYSDKWQLVYQVICESARRETCRPMTVL
mgnify:CR=1 FL=1